MIEPNPHQWDSLPFFLSSFLPPRFSFNASSVLLLSFNALAQKIQVKHDYLQSNTNIVPLQKYNFLKGKSVKYKSFSRQNSNDIKIFLLPHGPTASLLVYSHF